MGKRDEGDCGLSRQWQRMGEKKTSLKFSASALADKCFGKEKEFCIYRIAILLLGIVGYGLTMARTVSFWDCGEFIAAADVLGIPHPPGSPLFVLIARVFVILFGWIGGAAFAVNLLSAASSILCCLLIFEITVKVIPRNFFNSKQNENSEQNKETRKIGLLGFFAASISLFGDTFWFNAVEAEVYGISMLIIMLNIWAALKWKEEYCSTIAENEARQSKKPERWLFLIAYISILGCGIHTFSLLALPAIFLFVAGSVVAIKRRGNSILNNKTRAAFALCAVVFLSAIALSSQLYLPIRASVEPELNENNTAKIENFVSTLKRDQYGEMNMFERALYRRGSLVSQFGFSENIGYLGYHLNQWFSAPLGPQNLGEWKSGILNKIQFAHRIIFEFLTIAILVGVWIAIKRRRNFYSISLICAMFLLSSIGLVLYLNMADGTRADSEAAARWNKNVSELRKFVPDSIPDLPSLADLQVLFSFYTSLPEETRNGWLKKTPKAEGLRTIFAWDDALQAQGKSMVAPPRAVHRDVRNRDYFFTPAFLFFNILAAVALGAAFKNPALLFRLFCLFSWVIPFVSNFSSHNRSNDYIARDFAMNVLKSVPQNGILITYGDNDTFPLWYIQLVEKFRADVTVINESLSYSDWYRESIIARDSLIAGESYNPDGDFLHQVIKNNFPERSVNFILGANPANYAEFSENMPLVGLVRNLGMEKEEADSLMLANLTENYAYGDLNPRGQEANEQTISIYKYLARRALENPNINEKQFTALNKLLEQ